MSCAVQSIELEIKWSEDDFLLTWSSCVTLEALFVKSIAFKQKDSNSDLSDFVGIIDIKCCETSYQDFEKLLDHLLFHFEFR